MMKKCGSLKFTADMLNVLHTNMNEKRWAVGDRVWSRQFRVETDCRDTQGLHGIAIEPDNPDKRYRNGRSARVTQYNPVLTTRLAKICQ